MVLAALVLPPAVLAHLERPVAFPDHLKGTVPPYPASVAARATKAPAASPDASPAPASATAA